MSLTKQQQVKIRRLRKAGVECLRIATAVGVNVKVVSGFIAREKNNQSIRRMSEIARLVTVKCPETYMRERGVWYGEAA